MIRKMYLTTDQPPRPVGTGVQYCLPREGEEAVLPPDPDPSSSARTVSTLACPSTTTLLQAAPLVTPGEESSRYPPPPRALRVLTHSLFTKPSLSQSLYLLLILTLCNQLPRRRISSQRKWCSGSVRWDSKRTRPKSHSR